VRGLVIEWNGLADARTQTGPAKALTQTLSASNTVTLLLLLRPNPSLFAPFSPFFPASAAVAASSMFWARMAGDTVADAGRELPLFAS